MTPSSGSFWRLIKAARVGEVLAPARAPEGRFHHGGQRALYLSETAEGTRVAMAYYAKPGDPEQIPVALALNNAKLFDLRDHAQCAHLGIDPGHARSRWQQERAAGQVALSWAISDAARNAGADGMLYPSRSRPDLTHLVLFRWNQINGPVLATI